MLKATKVYCYEEVRNYRKILFIQSIVENGWWGEIHPPLDPPLLTSLYSLRIWQEARTTPRRGSPWAHIGAYLGGHCAMPHPLLLTLPFSKKEQNQWCQVTEICQTLLIVFVAYGQGVG